LTTVIDINADAGESFGRWRLGDDAALMPYVTSLKVACGYHAGDPTTIRASARLAARPALPWAPTQAFPTF
jgi:UPF0271 protein